MYDIIIIGGGPGGYVAAIRAAQLGGKICLIEKDRLGGTCLNYGCIPTKTLYRNAEIINTLKRSEEFGIKIDGYELNINQIHNRKQQVVESLVNGIEQLVRANKIDLKYGAAEIIDQNTVVVETENESIKVSGSNIIVATGSEPLIPEALNVPGVWTSNEALNFDSVPENLVVIGGGVIGMEFAGIMNSLGSKVTVIEYLPTVLNMLDSELVKRFTMLLKRKGIEVITSTSVSSIDKTEQGFLITADGKKGVIKINADNVLVATGRKPRIKGFGLEKLDVVIEKSGICVDDDYMTNTQGVYAIGDVNGKNMLAHEASWQAEAVAEKIMLNQRVTSKKPPVPACIFVFPEIAAVGLTEDEAKRKGIEYKTSKFMFGANGKAIAMGDTEGFVKIISENRNGTQIIVGVHIMGPHASDLIHEGALAVGLELAVTTITEMIHAHPTLSEAFHEAAGGINSSAIHMINIK